MGTLGEITTSEITVLRDDFFKKLKLSTNIVKLQEGVDEDVSPGVLTQRVLMRALTIVNHVRT